jgi:peptidoglycan-associated lipoprotein
MKMTKIVLSLILPLAVMLAVTGCGHKYPKVTNLSHGSPTGNGEGNPGGVAPGGSLGDGGQIGAAPAPYTGGPIGTSATWDPANMNQNREKLASYTVHFKFDSAVIEDSEQADVTSVSQALQSDASADLLIEGHCDERGTEEYNRALGERRALALREALAKMGVNADRIRTISYGKDQPVDPGHFEAAWSKNRRGVFVWCTPKTGAP